MKKIYLILMLFPMFLSAGIPELLPKPQKITENNQKFKIEKHINLQTSILKPQFEDFFAEIGVKNNSKSKKILKVEILNDLPNISLNKEEAYILKVEKHQILINATTEKGVFWALQTLRQLLVKKKSPYFEGCEIVDFPAFRIRGFMQDVGRSYISVEELKREILQLSKYKINVFHWHLTENQAWRIQSKKYPELNAPENHTRFKGKFYSFEEITEIVNFCKNNGVLLIPEIDMPGHSLAFTKAIKHDMQSPEGKRVLKEVLSEVLPYFDVPYIHIGTDEVEFKDPHFVPEMVSFVRSFGKKVISWNPGWDYKEGEIDMTHLWSYRGKAQKNIPAIDSKFHYINHFDTFSDLIGLYNSRILNVEKGSYDHAGGIMAVWHDRFIEDEQEILIQNNFYPSILAFAERSWLGGGTEYFDKNGTILPDENSEIFKNFVDFERRMLWHKEHYFKGFPFAYVKQTDVKWAITEPFYNDGNLKKSFPIERDFFEKERISKEINFEGKTYKTKKVIGASIYLRHTWGNTVPAFYKEPQKNHTAYAYTYVYSPKNQKVGLWFSSQHYSRSEKDLAPPQGKWDYKESQIWVNSKEILPPFWENSHQELSNEIPLKNENFEVREPLKVDLKKGWNKVLIKLPVGEFTSKEVRLVKWYFTCIFLADDLIYSID